MVEICFLGTGGSVATPDRDNTSFILNVGRSASQKSAVLKSVREESSGQSRTGEINPSLTGSEREAGQKLILVDCPGAIIHKMKKLGLRPQDVRSILVTHIHPDHIYGLPSLVHSLMLDEGLIRLYGSEETVEFCRSFLDFFSLRTDRIKTKVDFFPLKPDQTIKLNELDDIDNKSNTAASPEAVEIKVFSVPHHSSSLAYHFWFGKETKATDSEGRSFSETSPVKKKTKESTKADDSAGGAAQELPAKKTNAQTDTGDTNSSELSHKKIIQMIYSGDTAADAALFKKARNVDYLIHDSSSPSRIFAEYPVLYTMHTHSLDLGRLAQEAGVKWLIPCHFFGEVEFSISEIEREIRKNYKGHLLIPKDFMRFKL